MLAEIRSGMTTLADGTVAPARASRIGAIACADAQGKFYEASSRGTIFSMGMQSTASTAPTAGQVWGAGAAAATQFALWNPQGSGKNLSLLKFAIAVVSGTQTAGGVMHAVMATAPTSAHTITNGFLGCNNAGMAAATVARGYAITAGAALAGNSAPTNLRFANFAATATAAAVVGPTQCIEIIDGDIVLPPGTGWVPLWPSTGAIYVGYSITWEEIAI